MKKYLVPFVILLQLVLMAGCSIPYADLGKDTAGTTAGSEGQTAGTTTTTGGALTDGSAGGVTSPAALESTADVQAAAVDPRVGRIPVVLYYQDSDGFLIPVTRWIEKQQGIAKAALTGLIDSAITREELQYYGLYPVIPLDTDILGINIKDGIATVDFDKHLLNFADKASEKNMLDSVVYTLTGFKTINEVKIRINGYEQKQMKNGTELSGVFSRENLMINSSETAGVPATGKADIYVMKKANDMYTYAAPISVAFTGDTTTVGPQQVFSLLTRQKDENGVYNEIPEGVGVLGAVLNSGTLTVDFSKELAAYGGNAREEALMKQILYTAGQVKGTTKVRILIEGQPAELPEGTDLSAPVNVPAVINDVIDND